jgi:hypothetical protein
VRHLYGVVRDQQPDRVHIFDPTCLDPWLQNPFHLPIVSYNHSSQDNAALPVEVVAAARRHMIPDYDLDATLQALLAKFSNVIGQVSAG